MFEENLRHALELLDGCEEDGILYSRKFDLPAAGREQAREKIQTDLTSSWADLHDTHANKPARYGKVHPELAPLLDTDIQNLAGITRQPSAIPGET